MQSRRILVIDSRTDQLVKHEQALLAEGWLVLTSAKPEAAMLLARTFRPDTILLSADLASGAVLEIAAELRLDERTREVPLAMYSSAPQKLVIDALDVGADLVLPATLDATARARLRSATSVTPRTSTLRLFRFVRDCALDGVATVTASAGSGWASFSDGILVDASFAGFSGADAVVAMAGAQVKGVEFCGSDEVVEELDAEIEVVAEGPEHPWDLAA